MQKYAWRAKLLPGMRDEYVKRHREIWPEMVKELKDAGVRNYSIWQNGDDLFGYYECDDLEFTLSYQNKSGVVDLWHRYMDDCMYYETDPETGAPKDLVQVFELP